MHYTSNSDNDTEFL